MSTDTTPAPRTATELAARLAAERDGLPFLLFRDDGETQRLRALAADADHVTLGRDAGNDVHLGWDGEVSRAHAELVRVGGEWAISDQGLSRNGTFVNGRLVTGRRRLRGGDVIRVGRTLLAFAAPDPGTADATIQADDAPFSGELTEQQRRILSALCRPLLGGEGGAAPATNQAIADEVHLSVQGVKGQLRTLADRFGCGELPQNRKRLTLAERALRAGFGGPADD